MKRKLLHVGCGREPLPAWMLPVFDEVRLDIDPDVQPDIVAPMTDMGDIGPFDAIFTTHTLEHLYPDEVLPALREFKRVLKPGGGVVIVVPDLEGVQPTDDVVYESPGGPICGLDMIYGKASFVAANRYMAHHCGFIRQTLEAVMLEAEFKNVSVTRANFNLLAAGNA